MIKRAGPDHLESWTHIHHELSRRHTLLVERYGKLADKHEGLDSVVHGLLKRYADIHKALDRLDARMDAIAKWTQDDKNGK